MMGSSLGYLLSVASAYQSAAVLIAACDLDLFTWIVNQKRAVTTKEMASALQLDLRVLSGLVKALDYLGFLTRVQNTEDSETSEELWEVAEESRSFLDSNSYKSIVPYIQHSGACMRQWSGLAWTVKTGIPTPTTSSIRGPLGDNESFIMAMDNIAGTLAPSLVDKMQRVGLTDFSNMLDLGGGSGSYTKALLNRNVSARATIFDLPLALNLARNSLINSPLKSRITLVEGDFYRDELPTGFDFVWVSAIIHQHDNAMTRMLFQKAFCALNPGGTIAVRDVYFKPDGTGGSNPVFFNINMLCNTRTGKTYRQDEVIKLLTQVGFVDANITLPADDMTAVITAKKV